MRTISTKQVAGQLAELHVFSELLKQGVSVYKPLVDEGLDALARLPDGQVIELQIKSASGAGGKDPRWFQMPDFTPRPNFFIMCVTCLDGVITDVWVFPSMVFDAYSTGAKSRHKIRDLNLDSGVRKYGNPLTDHLCGFRNRWELISNYEEWRSFMTSPEGFEDLEDILAAKEAFESPEEEKRDFTEYVRSESKSLSSHNRQPPGRAGVEKSPPELSPESG